MDFATLFGLLLGIGVIMGAVATASDLSTYLNLPGLMIVLGGTIAAVLIKFPIRTCMHSFFLAMRTAFFDKPEKPDELISAAKQLAKLVQKKGLLALDDASIKDPFFKKGCQLCADGYPSDFVSKVLTNDMELSIKRHVMGEKVFRAIGESAPAFGMIGTLIGLIQMLSHMEEPSKIGVGMAVALLTTLYGALIANLFALPIADKLQVRAHAEHCNKSIIIESVLSLLQKKSPHAVEELLSSYLPHRRQVTLDKSSPVLPKQRTSKNLN